MTHNCQPSSAMPFLSNATSWTPVSFRPVVVVSVSTLSTLGISGVTEGSATSFSESVVSLEMKFHCID